VGHLEDLKHQCDENSRVIAELTERIRLLELKDQPGSITVKYPESGMYINPPGATSLTYNTSTVPPVSPSPESEPMDTDLPGSPSWHDNPQNEGEDG
jgi:hypothetical protein